MIAKIGNQIAHPVLRVWRRLPLPLQGKIQIALPLLAVVCSAIIAVYGNYQRAQIEAAMQRHIQTVGELNNALTLMINAETGMRGYLLTRRAEFLQPYTTATGSLPATLAQLRALAQSEPGENPRVSKLSQLDQLGGLIDQQMVDLAWQQQHVAAAPASDDEIYRHLALGKQLMDQIRANINAAYTQENQLLSDRLAEINAIRNRDYLAVFLTLVVGLGTRLVAWYLFNTGVLRRIERLVEYTRALRRGARPSFAASGKQDALGSLEHEIGLVHEQLDQQHGK